MGRFESWKKVVPSGDSQEGIIISACPRSLIKSPLSEAGVDLILYDPNRMAYMTVSMNQTEAARLVGEIRFCLTGRKDKSA